MGWTVAAAVARSGIARADGCEMRAQVARVDEADGLILQQPIEGATMVRLAGIDAPRPRASSADRPGAARQRRAPPWPNWPKSAVVCLSLPPQKFDRYGRLLAQVVGDDGLWLQERTAASRSGARPYHPGDAGARPGDAGDRNCRPPATGSGYGARPSSGFATPPTPAGSSAASSSSKAGWSDDPVGRKDWWYLNFGEDWRNDFTVEHRQGGPAAVRRSGFDLFALQGKVIRVRGWMEKLNGPMIEVNHPEQIEILAEPPAG